MLRLSWRAWLSQGVPRVGPWWIDHVWTVVFALGVGAAFAINKAYYLRWEVRDNYIGVVKVSGATPDAGFIPPHETAYKHLFSVHVGFDVVLERQRGRRY